MKKRILLILLMTSFISLNIIGCHSNVAPSPMQGYETLPGTALKNIEKDQKIVKKDRHYLKYSNGIIYDLATNLEWYPGPEKDTSFDDAINWVKHLKIGGGDWRMPTRSELKSLYEKGNGSINMPPLLAITGIWIWSGEEKDSDSSLAWTFNYAYGYGHWDFRDNDAYFRGFAVRSP